jgi:hypothetical protein
MEWVAIDVEVLHLGIADLNARLVGPRVERTLDLQASVGRRRPISSTTANLSVNGRPRQVCVIWQNKRCSILFHFEVPGG